MRKKYLTKKNKHVSLLKNMIPRLQDTEAPPILTPSKI